MKQENKRNFFRLLFKHPLCAGLKIIGRDDIETDVKIIKAAIVDLSAGGSHFFTAIPLPEEERLLIELKFTALGKEYKTLGTIVRTILPKEGHYEYSAQFSLNEPDIAALTSMLNTLSIKLRKTPILSNCSFCTDEDLAEFKPLSVS